MAYLRMLACCGIKELDGIEHVSAVEALRNTCEYIDNGYECAYIVFSAVKARKDRRSKAERLAVYITQNQLGHLVKAPTRKNPNTSNRLDVYVWTPSRKSLRTWAVKHRV